MSTTLLRSEKKKNTGGEEQCCWKYEITPSQESVESAIGKIAGRSRFADFGKHKNDGHADKTYRPDAFFCVGMKTIISFVDSRLRGDDIRMSVLSFRFIPFCHRKDILLQNVPGKQVCRLDGIIEIMQSYQHKGVIIFDLDGTLTESKTKIGRDMIEAMEKLLAQKKVAVIGGGKYAQFKEQFVDRLQFSSDRLENLYLFPANATSFYRFKNRRWNEVYQKKLTIQEKKSIRQAFALAFKKTGYVAPKKIWGVVIEDRKTEMTFSALGQHAPLEAKEKWNATADIRPKLINILRRALPRFEIREGGETSIDITRRGIDKAYGVREIEKYLKTPIKDMIFIGDALYRGGNDAAAKKTGIKCIAVRGPKDTKKIIEKIIE